jgi:hypothetical protein
LQHQPHDVAACRVGERMEQQVGSLIYNHMVVR